MKDSNGLVVSVVLWLPLSQRLADFERWPRYKTYYLHAFRDWIKRAQERGNAIRRNKHTGKKCLIVGYKSRKMMLAVCLIMNTASNNCFNLTKAGQLNVISQKGRIMQKDLFDIVPIIEDSPPHLFVPLCRVMCSWRSMRKQTGSNRKTIML